LKITYPGTAGVGHQWAYLPDAAETIVGLVEKSAELETFAVFHMEGHWDKDGKRMDRASMAADAALVAFRAAVSRTR